MKAYLLTVIFLTCSFSSLATTCSALCGYYNDADEIKLLRSPLVTYSDNNGASNNTSPGLMWTYLSNFCAKRVESEISVKVTPILARQVITESGKVILLIATAIESCE